MINLKLFLWALLGILSACGGVTTRQPLALAQAQTADQDARQALKNGELLRAQQGFARTLLFQQSLDDAAGAATTLINLATVTHQLDDDEAALAWLDKVLQDEMRIYPSESHQIASFRKAVILTKLARLNEAELALQLSQGLCGKNCVSRSGIDTLRARLLLLNGDAEGALALALTVNQEDEAEKEEGANALRVAAAAEEKLAHAASALQYYSEALELDKLLGLSQRIGEDLSGMARTSMRLGREQAAAEYARRAALANHSYRQTVTPVSE